MKSFFDLHRFQLSNGLRVWCVPRPGTQTVALMMQVPVGSRHETEANNGISHFLEHMVFTGTERWNEAEVTDVVRRRGGECNAQTSREETVYYLHIASQDLAFGLDWLEQLLFKPTLVEEKFEKERRVIINEKGGEYDYLRRAWLWLEDHNLGWSVSRAVRRRLLPDPSLLLPIIGTDKSLKAITLDNLQNYHQTYYTPNNMTLLVIGDVDVDEALALAEQQFGAIPSRPLPLPRPPMQVNTRPFHIHLHGPTPNQQGQLLIGAPLGPSNHPDRFAWSVIAEILENAYLQDIRYQNGLSYDVQVYPVLYTDAGYFVVYTSAKRQDFATIRQTIEHHLNRIVTGDFSEQELREAQGSLQGRTLLGLQDNVELAWWFSTDSLALDNTDTYDYFNEIERLTHNDVQRVAAHYLAAEKRFSAEHRPPFPAQNLKPFAAVGAAGVAGAMLFWGQRRRLRQRGS